MSINEELKEFVQRVAPAVSPQLAEVLSDETRRIQKIVLLLGSILLVIASGSLQLSGEFQQAGIKATLSEVSLASLLSKVLIYFEVLFALRCYSDFHVWRVNSTAAALDMVALQKELESQSPNFSEEIEERARMNFAESANEADVEFAVFQARRAFWTRLHVSAVKKEGFEGRARAIRISRTVRIVLEIAFPLVLGATAIAVTLWTP